MEDTTPTPEEVVEAPVPVSREEFDTLKSDVGTLKDEVSKGFTSILEKLTEKEATADPVPEPEPAVVEDTSETEKLKAKLAAVEVELEKAKVTPKDEPVITPVVETPTPPDLNKYLPRSVLNSELASMGFWSDSTKEG